jgi:hypothetical protein
MCLSLSLSRCVLPLSFKHHAIPFEVNGKDWLHAERIIVPEVRASERQHADPDSPTLCRRGRETPRPVFFFFIATGRERQVIFVQNQVIMRAVLALLSLFAAAASLRAGVAKVNATMPLGVPLAGV